MLLSLLHDIARETMGDYCMVQITFLWSMKSSMMHINPLMKIKCSFCLVHYL